MALQDEAGWHDLKVTIQVENLEARNQVGLVERPCSICGREYLVFSDQIERFPYCGRFGCLHDAS